MTLLHTSSSYPTTSLIEKSIRLVRYAVSRGVNKWIAAMISYRERQVQLALLRSFSDRELKDMGLYRCQIGDGFDQAAKDRQTSPRPR
jgi:uncharacterized protein YjiS (DUF1127 family)